MCNLPLIDNLYNISCTHCENQFHPSCLNLCPRTSSDHWCCNYCLMNELPFAVNNPLDLCATYDASLTDALPRSVNTLTDLIEEAVIGPNIMFNPLDSDNDNSPLLMDDNLDPDLNLYNDLYSYSSLYKDLKQIDTYLHNLTYSHTFGIAHLNCRSMWNKQSDIHLLLVQAKIDILALTETWLEQELEAYVNIPGYTFVHKARRQGGGGGVGFLIKSVYKFEIIEDRGFDSRQGTFESIFITIPQEKSRDLIIGSIYRPPDSSIVEFTTDMSSTLIKLSNSNSSLYLAGDFNINLLRSGDHLLTSSFFNLMTSHKLFPTILRPTRITSYTATLIDNIFTNSLTNNQDSCICISDISDHLPVLLYIDLRDSDHLMLRFL